MPYLASLKSGAILLTREELYASTQIELLFEYPPPNKAKFPTVVADKDCFLSVRLVTELLTREELYASTVFTLAP